MTPWSEDAKTCPWTRTSPPVQPPRCPWRWPLERAAASGQHRSIGPVCGQVRSQVQVGGAGRGGGPPRAGPTPPAPPLVASPPPAPPPPPPPLSPSCREARSVTAPPRHSLRLLSAASAVTVTVHRPPSVTVTVTVTVHRHRLYHRHRHRQRHYGSGGDGPVAARPAALPPAAGVHRAVRGAGRLPPGCRRDAGRTQRPARPARQDGTRQNLPQWVPHHFKAYPYGQISIWTY